MNKVLIITYYWPPSGGAGVQRWLKFSKYLPDFGWEPVILTVDRRYAAYPVTDNSLVDDLPKSLRVYSTRATDYFRVYGKNRSRIPAAGFANSMNNKLKDKVLRFIRGNFFIPDPRKGWNKYAFKKACELIESEGINHVITTSPPHSTQLIGLKIRKKYKDIKWLADLRDPWTDIYYYDQFYHTSIAKYIDSLLERQVLKKADRIITVGKSLKASFSLKVKGIENKTEVITNGYDESDFVQINYSPVEIFTISYIGTLSDAYPVEGFIDALGKFITDGNNCRIRFIGAVSPKQKDLIIKGLPGNKVDFIPYVDHTAAIKYMLESSLLLLIIPDHHSNGSIITGKLFEYMASRRQVICLGPQEGDASEILRLSGHGTTFYYSDSTGILGHLSKLYADNRVIEKIPSEAFSRRELTRRLVSLLEKL
jgi:glycosyltransferase involved in cell wall biosynthesis